MNGTWRPLEGLRVVDLTRMLPGGTATLLLADLGAEVVKVEHPDGDDTRWLEPRLGEDSSAQHHYMDRGKRSVRIDLKSPDGARQVLDLCRGADAVVESFRPGVADRLGVGASAVAEVAPAALYLSMSGYGSTGPKAQYAGHDINFVAAAGLTDDIPQTQHADVPAGMLAALGIVAGVMRARATGKGEHLDLSLSDAALTFGGVQIAERLAATQLGVEVGTPLDGTAACYQIYRCEDGRSLCVAALEPKFWLRVVTALGHPEWFDRKLDRTLTPELAALFARRPRAHWLDLLDGPDTCVTPAGDVRDLVEDEHVLQRRSLVQVPSPAGPVWQVAPPLKVVAKG